MPASATGTDVCGSVHKTGKIQMEDHAYEKVGTELVREAQTVTASNADEKLESATDEEEAKAPGDHGL